MKSTIFLSMLLPWAIIAAPLDDERPGSMVEDRPKVADHANDIKAREPGHGVSDWYSQPGQDDVQLDGWKHQIDQEGFDVFGQPAYKPRPAATSSSTTAVTFPPASATSSSSRAVVRPPPTATLGSGRVGPNPFAGNTRKS